LIRVFIVAASPLARAGLENLLTQSRVPAPRRGNTKPPHVDSLASDIEMVGVAESIDAFEAGLLDNHLDVVLIDTSGVASDSILAEIADAELAADLPIVVLSDRVGADWQAQALQIGVRAILPAEATASQLLAAIQGAAAGLVVLHRADVNAVLAAAVPPTSRSIAPASELAEPLTRREREVLQMLAAGLGNKEIATRLSISDHTAKFHVASILGKLGASTRTEAVAIGIRHHLILL
jgi:two-component system, NarL family, response regulator YdfI